VLVGPGPRAYIGGRMVSTEVLLKGLAPYLVLNLAELRSIGRGERGPTRLELYVYIKGVG